MPVRFTRLRLAGFKSFVEPATVEIRPGLTGIVGPNGCGKSNVVEALRWAMGESSARSLRGGEMEDVIFAGTGARPSRNLAEVTLGIEASDGALPPPFDRHPELEVTRRIERGTGSTFRVNGRETRARDVQTLFADLASGAHSSAMVGQGRVGAIVNARPEARRALLEEAAGITGLHARRHEAELKLRAAEANLARAEDTRGQLETQLAALKRQARQASRYRNISGAIRAAEAELLSVQRAHAEARRAAARAALHDAELATAAATENAAASARRAADTEAVLPVLRTEEAEARTLRERRAVGVETLTAERARLEAEARAAAARATALAGDLAHAEAAARAAADAGARLDDEDARLAAEDAAHPELAEAAEAARRETDAAVRAAEAAAQRATEAAAEGQAASDAIRRAHAAAEQASRRAAAQRAEAEAVVARLRSESVPADALATAETEAARCETEARAARAALTEAESERQRAASALAACRATASSAEAALAKVRAEEQALAELLSVRDGERWPPMLDQLSVPAGLELALGAALGEELSSAADPDAARHWRPLPPLDGAAALPVSAMALDVLIAAPPALARALSQIGLIDDAPETIPELAPGQVLVTCTGAVWRWDGYTIRAGAPTAAAVRLQQRNRLADIRARRAGNEADAAAARQAATQAHAADEAAQAADRAARAAQRSAETALAQTREHAARLAAKAAGATARLDAAQDKLTRAMADETEANAALAAANAALADLPDMDSLRRALAAARADFGAAREAEACARATHETITRAHGARTARRAAIATDQAAARERRDAERGRAASLSDRAAQASAEAMALVDAPARVADAHREAVEALDAAEGAWRRAADVLRAAADAAEAAAKGARAAEAALAAAREAAIRAQAGCEHADAAWGVVAERILERLGADAALPDPPADLGPDSEERARKRHERLLRERDEMGPVNLRAEIEADEVATQIETIARERDELASAIAKLRGSIGHLNREGRERLSAVFADIDRHFQALFTRMFGGGRAHLALVGSDDPLEAGLEVYAQPPGKKLSALSLLSGGEQALTALSIIFAVFRCNPAPVCVLDEVDAPLDDANVDRFCHLLDDMVRETATRFLVVTHHPLTMARMDRLYGVTMQERGVSRLLSVDLSRATELAEMPLAAE